MRKRKHYRRRRRERTDDNSIRLLILSVLILLAVIFKVVTGISAVTVFEELGAVVTGEESYGDFINELGKNISNGAKENIVAVFGNDVEQTNNDKNELPIITEQTRQTEETNEGRVNIIPAFNNDINIASIELIENEEEYTDDTENEPFIMPVPDNVDTEAYDINFNYNRPCNGRITSPFGYRVHPISKETTFHYGIDLAANEGNKILSFADGKVTETGESTIFGNYIKIQHADGFVSFYGHLSKVNVKKNEFVKRGNVIGNAGATGVATGPHLHFEIRKNGKVIDPEQYF
ncbi:MAG: M23 family metallopeptidase [Clostridia bacterium]|nr:M23 family metallopeptidase [Clostridia bacterium]